MGGKKYSFSGRSSGYRPGSKRKPEYTPRRQQPVLLKRGVWLEFDGNRGTENAYPSHHSMGSGFGVGGTLADYTPFFYVSMLFFPVSLFAMGFLALTDKNQNVKTEAIRCIVLFAAFFGKFVLAAVIAGGIVFLLAPADYKDTAMMIAVGVTGILFLLTYGISVLLIAYRKMKSDMRIPLVDNVVSLFLS